MVPELNRRKSPLVYNGSNNSLFSGFRAYNKTKWKGCMLTVQNAKENDVKKYVAIMR